ncbi:MAG: helix-turn-helix domain-containing protein [Ruminococcus sp.]|nr:helix-turn-helix domain-containing protein [Ruminococcus sp.]
MNAANPAITGELIRRLRKELGLTQQALADMLFVSAKAVSKWECGKGMPDLTQLNNLSEIFSVPAEVILKGELTQNDIQGGHMKNLKFYVCPACGNIFTSSGEGQISCCGKKLCALVPKKAEENQRLSVEKIDGEYFISSSHEMTKENYISFCALITGDALLMRKTYPEWDFQLRMPMLSHGTLAWYSASEGLIYQYV